jgi:hypothetical protein
MYSNGQVRISGETVHGSANFDRAMVIRPTQARPPGQTDPNKT